MNFLCLLLQEFLIDKNPGPIRELLCRDSPATILPNLKHADRFREAFREAREKKKRLREGEP